MRYFTCEGRFSRLYSYHIHLLMYFTRVRMMNIPFFMCRNIEKMVPIVQRKNPAQPLKSIYHYALIEIIVMHQLAQQGIPWEDFISRDFFTVPHPPPEIVHDEGGPSQQFDIHEGPSQQFDIHEGPSQQFDIHEGPSQQSDIHETEHVDAPAYVTYQKGPRALFAAARRVLSPPGVEGVSLTSSAQRVLSPHHVEGVSPSSSAQV